jgi:hypothetical protein
MPVQLHTDNTRQNVLHIQKYQFSFQNFNTVLGLGVLPNIDNGIGLVL